MFLQSMKSEKLCFEVFLQFYDETAKCSGRDNKFLKPKQYVIMLSVGLNFLFSNRVFVSLIVLFFPKCVSHAKPNFCKVEILPRHQLFYGF